MIGTERSFLDTKSDKLPLVTVIIPVFNAEKFITACVQSVLIQSYQNLEIIIIDDGSTDASIQKVQSLDDNRIKIYEKENGGASSARNLGLDYFSGDFVQYLDADDLLDSKKIENQLKLLAGRRSHVTFCNYHIYENSSKSVIKRIPAFSSDYDNPIELILDSWQKNEFIATHAWLIPREIIEKCGKWNENLKKNEDGEYFFRMLLSTEKVIFDSKSYVLYTKYGNQSLSQINKEILAHDVIKSFDLIVKIVEEKNLQILKKPVAQQYLKLLFLSYPKIHSLEEIVLGRIRKMGFTVNELLQSARLQRLHNIFGLDIVLLLSYILKRSLYHTRRLRKTRSHKN